MTARILFCAPSSGTGKTTVTCAVLRAMQRKGLKLAACKSGPDYIGPMFHQKVLETPSTNLDLFFFPPQTARALLRQVGEGADLTVLEGAMGFYDGIAMSEQASAYDLAVKTETPAVLVLDGRGSALSLAATIRGFAAFRSPNPLRGVILNRVKPAMAARLGEMLLKETGLPLLGCLPPLPDCAFESRHLGLVTAGEIAGLKEKLDKLADAAADSIDLDALLALAREAPALTETLALPKAPRGKVKIAVARDEAFCFYYETSLDILRALGAELLPFSPLRDKALPKGACGLYLGGGYPELHAETLAMNHAMREAVRAAVTAGMPTIAECGGFLYLHRTIKDQGGHPWLMAGVLDAEGYPTGQLSRFGYVTLKAQGDSLLFPAGAEMPAHEFHYWDSTNPGAAFAAQKPQSSRGWETGVATESLYAGFPHFHFASDPQAAVRFLAAARRYRKAQKEMRK